MDWYVPVADESAVIYHGHENVDDHSDCGPQIFCCPKAASLLLSFAPKSCVAFNACELTDGKHLTSWLSPVGPKIYYFYFCDPDDWQAIYFVGVRVPDVREVLLKRLPLDPYISTAHRMSARDRSLGGDRS